MMIVAMGWKEDWNDIAFFRRAFQKFRSVKPRNIEINFRIPTRLGLQIYRWCHARHDTKVGFRFIRFSKLSYVQRKSFTRHLLNLVPSIVTLRYYIFGPPQAPKNSKFIFFSQFGSIFQQGESSSFRQYFFKFLERTTQIWKFIPGFPEKKTLYPVFPEKKPGIIKTGYNILFRQKTGIILYHYTRFWV